MPGSRHRASQTPDGGSGGLDVQGMGVVRIWDVATGALVRDIPAHCGFYASSAEFSHDGTLLATSGFEGPVEIWRVADGALVTSIPYAGATIYTARFSPDDTLLVTAATDQTARVWRAADGALLQTLAGHAAYVSSVRWIDDGRFVSNDWSGGVRSWARDVTGAFAVAKSWSTGGQSLGLAVAPDGSTVVAGGADPATKVEGFTFLPL